MVHRPSYIFAPILYGAHTSPFVGITPPIHFFCFFRIGPEGAFGRIGATHGSSPSFPPFGPERLCCLPSWWLSHFTQAAFVPIARLGTTKSVALDVQPECVSLSLHSRAAFIHKPRQLSISAVSTFWDMFLLCSARLTKTERAIVAKPAIVRQTGSNWESPRSVCLFCGTAPLFLRDIGDL